MATPAPSCKAALAEATKRWPKRNRASDGIMGDKAHQNRKSDHNLGNAFDLTDDPKHGCHAHVLVNELALRKDKRVKYIISLRQIWNPVSGSAAAYAMARRHGVGRIAAFRAALPGWRKYTGTNPHIKHAHVSIKSTSRNDTSTWWSQPKPKPVPVPPELKEVISEVIYKEDQVKATTFNVKLDGKGNKVFLRKDISRKRVINVTFGSVRKRAPRWTLRHDANRKGTEFTFFDGQKNGTFEVTVWQALG